MHTVSNATGVSLPTITDIDRKLVAGKLRTKAGRGFSAAQMTPLDAARLLTAVLASPQANVSVEAVARYARTRIDKTRSSDKLFGAIGLDDLLSFPARHSFVDGLAALITSAATGSLAQLIAQSKDGWIPQIEIFAFTRATRGRIRISGLPNGLTASVEYVPVAARSTAARSKKEVTRAAIGTDSFGDLEQSRRLTERTVLSVAQRLAKES